VLALQFLDVIQVHEIFFIVLLFSDQILQPIELAEIIYLPLNLVKGQVKQVILNLKQQQVKFY